MRGMNFTDDIVIHITSPPGSQRRVRHDGIT
jgi:hypothetical protein